MKVHESANLSDFVQDSESWLHQAIPNNQETKLYIPAGQTPIPLYEHLTQIKPLYLQNTTFVQIDDIINSPKEGIFSLFLEQHLSTYQKQIYKISDNLPVQADAAILGLGTNGHVAFHEPGMPIDFYHGRVHLKDETCDNLGLQHGTIGISYGLAAFMSCKKVLLLVSGRGKEQALSCLLGNQSQSLPVEVLKKHKDLTVIINAQSLS